MKKAAVRPVGLGVVSEQMLPRPDLLSTEYYCDFLRKNDCEAAVGVTIMREHGRAFNMSTLTARADPDANMAGARVLTNLAPHLQRAFRHYRGRPPMATTEQMSMLDAAGIAVVMVGPSGTMMSANPSAMKLVDRGEVCSISPVGRFLIGNVEAAMVMRQMLAIGTPVPRHFTYYEPTPHGQAKVTLVRLNKDPVTEFFAGPTVALLIDILRMEVGELASRLRSRHGLTPAEARLAQALDWGATVKEAANTFGISEGTARQQLKAIFRKVGVSRQAELIRAIHDPTFVSR